MKRLIVSLCMSAFLAATAAEYEISWPKETQGDRLVKIELSSENLAHLGGHPEWLRLYDCVGTVVPWARRQRSVPVYGERRVNVPLVMDEVRHGEGGQLEILCHVGDGQAVLPESVRLSFQTAMKDFEQQVVVYGSDADGAEKTLLSDGFIFESSANLELKNTEVAFATQGCRRFRIELGAASMERRTALRQISREWNNDAQTRLSEQQSVTDQAFKIDGVQMWSKERAVVGEEAQWDEYPAGMQSVGTDVQGVSCYQVTPAIYPVSGLRLCCMEENYSRAVTVYHIYNNTERRLCTGTVRRFSLGTLKDESLLTFDAVYEGQLRIAVVNNDNPPLHVLGATTRNPLYDLRFVGNAMMLPFRLTAEPGGLDPVYDMGELLSFGKEDPANVIVVHPDKFSGTTPVVSPPSSERRGLPRSVLVGAIALAVIAMAAALFSTLKKVRD